MTKINIFIFSAIFYLAGVFINNFFENILYSFIVLLFVGLFFLILCFRLKKYFFILFFCIFTFFIGIFVSYYNLEKINENLKFIEYFSKNTEIISEIQEVKEVKDGNVVYRTKILSLDGNIPKNNIFAEVFLEDRLERLKKGQVISSESKLYFYKNSSGFSYKNFMISNSYYFKYYANKYKNLEKRKINKIEEKIISIRENLLSIIKENFPKNEAIFLGGILLGAREELPKELKENFNNSGLTHFIAVSGFNITILIIFFTFFVKYLPKNLRIFIMCLIIFLFVILVGPSAPVVRAGIMGFIGYLVLQNGRQGNILAITLLTLIFMVTYNPFSINYDVSLHLSFLAVLGIIYTEKFFNKIFSFLPNFFEIRTAVSITFAALVFTLPIMIFSFGQLSIIAPISNLLVSWSIPLAMLFGFLSILGYIFFTGLGEILGFLAFLVLKWNMVVVNFFGNIDFLVFKVNFGQYAGYFQFIYLLTFAFLIIYFNANKKE